VIEIVRNHFERGHVRFAVFDMDGTLSLIREGWQIVMASAMLDELLKTPAHEPGPELRRFLIELVTQTTGQTTSFQMNRLAEEVRKRGGQAEDPLIYKQRYLARLGERIGQRVADLKAGRMIPDEMMVPGSREILEDLRMRGVHCYLVSGTYEPYLLDEAEVLHIAAYFEGMYGAQDDPTRFSKRRFLERFVAEHRLHGYEWVSIGDGITEIKEAKCMGGIAVGVASNEAERIGMDERKRELLIEAGADIIVPDFQEHQKLVAYLFNGSNFKSGLAPGNRR
jgi:phosphoglycolate phosphatase-like HAD superfamily hydrolase